MLRLVWLGAGRRDGWAGVLVWDCAVGLALRVARGDSGTCEPDEAVALACCASARRARTPIAAPIATVRQAFIRSSKALGRPTRPRDA